MVGVKATHWLRLLRLWVRVMVVRLLLLVVAMHGRRTVWAGGLLVAGQRRHRRLAGGMAIRTRWLAGRHWRHWRLPERTGGRGRLELMLRRQRRHVRRSGDVQRRRRRRTESVGRMLLLLLLLSGQQWWWQLLGLLIGMLRLLMRLMRLLLLLLLLWWLRRITVGGWQWRAGARGIHRTWRLILDCN